MSLSREQLAAIANQYDADTVSAATRPNYQPVVRSAEDLNVGKMTSGDQLDSAKLSRSKAPRPEISTTIGNRHATVTAVPASVLEVAGPAYFTKVVSFELKTEGASQAITRTARFSQPVQVDHTGVYMPRTTRSRHGERSTQMEKFDPKMVFNPGDRKVLKSMGVSFNKS